MGGGSIVRLRLASNCTINGHQSLPAGVKQRDNWRLIKVENDGFWQLAHLSIQIDKTLLESYFAQFDLKVYLTFALFIYLALFSRGCWYDKVSVKVDFHPSHSTWMSHKRTTPHHHDFTLLSGKCRWVTELGPCDWIWCTMAFNCTQSPWLLLSLTSKQVWMVIKPFPNWEKSVKLRLF